MADGFRTIRYGYLLPVLAVMFLMQVLRSFRWGLILSPLEKIDQLSLFSVTSVGFLAIIAIPARLGELARPYLITKKSRIKMSSALGTIVVERVFDSLTVLVIAVFVLFFTPLPPWLIRSSVLFLLLTLALVSCNDPDDRQTRGVAAGSGPAHREAAGALCRRREPSHLPFHRWIPDHGRSGAPHLRHGAIDRHLARRRSVRSICCFSPSVSSCRSWPPLSS